MRIKKSCSLGWRSCTRMPCPSSVARFLGYLCKYVLRSCFFICKMRDSKPSCHGDQISEDTNCKQLHWCQHPHFLVRSVRCVPGLALRPVTAESCDGAPSTGWWKPNKTSPLVAQVVKNQPANQFVKLGFDPWVGKIPWRSLALQAPLSMGFSRQEIWSG